MKNEQSLRKTPIEPLAFLPASPLTGTPSGVAAGMGARIIRRAPAFVRTGVFADLTPSVYAALVLCWSAFMSIFFITFAGSPFTMFMLALITVYAVMFFGVPIAMNRIGAREIWSDPGISAFLRAKVDTLYGPVNGTEALVQVVLVPACLTIGSIGIALAVASARAMY